MQQQPADRQRLERYGSDTGSYLLAIQKLRRDAEDPRNAVKLQRRCLERLRKRQRQWYDNPDPRSRQHTGTANRVAPSVFLDDPTRHWTDASYGEGLNRLLRLH